MPRTLFEKIWDAHLVAQRADGRELIYIDRHVLHELHAPHAFESLEKQGRPVRRPDLTFSALDHTVATKPGRNDGTNPSGTAFLKAMREGSRRNGIRLFDIDDQDNNLSGGFGNDTLIGGNDINASSLGRVDKSIDAGIEN